MLNLDNNKIIKDPAKVAKRDELLAKLRAVEGDYTANQWHSACEMLLAAIIVDKAKDWDHAGKILITTKQSIGALVLKNWDRPVGPG